MDNDRVQVLLYCARKMMDLAGLLKAKGLPDEAGAITELVTGVNKKALALEAEGADSGGTKSPNK